MTLPGLSFSLGLRIQDEIRASLGSPVSSSLSDSFSLVDAFGRCKFKLSESSVGLILQATIDGNASLFEVSALGGRAFRFMVATKVAGLFIHRLGFFECDLYKVFFHLWGHGGPNWRREFKLFLEEERVSWQPPPSSRLSSRPSYADMAHQPALKILPCLTGANANAVPLGSDSLLTGANAVPLEQYNSRL